MEEKCIQKKDYLLCIKQCIIIKHSQAKINRDIIYADYFLWDLSHKLLFLILSCLQKLLQLIRIDLIKIQLKQTTKLLNLVLQSLEKRSCTKYKKIGKFWFHIRIKLYSAISCIWIILSFRLTRQELSSITII